MTAPKADRGLYLTGLLCIALAAALVVSCGDKDSGTAGEDCATDDADADGLDECDELALGTDPDVADSDGDGLDDGTEADCVSDPLDSDEVCYSCGWPHNDPGDLTSGGAEIGDTINNLQLVDQCGEALSMWDLYGEYHILMMTAEW